MFPFVQNLETKVKCSNFLSDFNVFFFNFCQVAERKLIDLLKYSRQTADSAAGFGPGYGTQTFDSVPDID